MKPYYEDDRVTVYNADCDEVLPGLPSSSAQLLLTDPPYGVDFQSNRRALRFDKIAGDDGSADIRASLALACNVLARSRHAYIFGPKDVLPEELTARVDLIWDKEYVGMGNLQVPWGPAHESITFAVNQPSKANRADGFGGLTARMRRGSVIRCPRPTNGAGSRRHPNEKPVLLLRQIIESSTVWGETVLDPFMGSGSTLVAAMLEGRRAVGIEVSERYCEMAVTRLRQDVRHAA